MRTWNDYKNHVNAVDPEMAKDLKETEEIAAIVSAMIEQRKSEVTSYCLVILHFSTKHINFAL